MQSPSHKSPLLEQVVRSVSPVMHKKFFGGNAAFLTNTNTTNDDDDAFSILVNSQLRPPKHTAHKTTTTTTTQKKKKTKSSEEEDEESESESEEDCDDSHINKCITPEKEQVQDIQIGKSPHKSALKTVENRLAAKFGFEDNMNFVRRRSISFANEDEFQVKLIPKNQTGTPEVTCMISGSTKRKIGEAERLKIESGQGGGTIMMSLLGAGRRSSNRSSTPSCDDNDDVNNDNNDNDNKKPRRSSSVSFTANDSDPSPEPTRNAGERKIQDTPAIMKRASLPLSYAEENNTPVVVAVIESEITTTTTTKSIALTTGGLKSRPQAPNNTPATGGGAVTSEFNLDGFDLFRQTPNAKAIRAALLESAEDVQDEAFAKSCLSKGEKLFANMDSDIINATELAKALEQHKDTMMGNSNRVLQWLSDADADEEEAEEMIGEEEDDKENNNNSNNKPSPSSLNKKAPTSPAKSASSPQTLCIKAKKSKKHLKKNMKRSSKSTNLNFGLALKFEKLHQTLKETRSALLKERLKTQKLKNLLFEAAQREEEQERKRAAIEEEKKNCDVVVAANNVDRMCVFCKEINDTVKVMMNCVSCQCFAHGKCANPRLRRIPTEWKCPNC